MDLEQLVLSGALFNGGSRSSSPARSPSPDHEWPTDGHASDYDSDVARNSELEKTLAAAPSIGMGPGRTGVKGVIRDRAEAQSMERERRNREVDTLNRRMEKASLGGKTFLEEERERDWEKIMLEGVEPGLLSAGHHAAGGKGRGRFGHLREVGAKGFVAAVEQEAPGVWVVVHIYDPSLDRCYTLDTTLSRLARHNPQTKFLRTRAGALGFAKLPSSRTASSISRPRRTVARDDGDDDPYVDDADHDLDDENTDDDIDLDMLPTLLVYREGELVHNWVRVDWEAGRQGVDELLSNHHILQISGVGSGNCGLPSDDEDELLDSEFE